MPSLITWYHTLRHLKRRQLGWQVWRPFAMAFSRRHHVRILDIDLALHREPMELLSLSVAPCYFPQERRFCFLNTSQVFEGAIDWDCPDHGRLWAYHLNYFEWLYDDALSVEERLDSIHSFVAAKRTKVGDEAYPTSLRIVAWVRFLLRYGISDEPVLKRLYRDADWLCRFPEYQIDGNHLFENALALVSAGAFFGNGRIYKRGTGLLLACVREQILPDGGHVEGSPMYHSLLLWRSLQCLELLRVLPFRFYHGINFWTRLNSKMLGWLEAVTFSDGSWPQFQDATVGIAPTTEAIRSYAAALGLQAQQVQASESGIRTLRAGEMELAVQCGPLQPVFQPGHSHAAIGTFCLHYQGRPVIVDTGVSTYEAGAIRRYERSTEAHNTVVVGGKDSSEMWRSFRVGRRAELIAVNEEGGWLELVYVPYAFPKCRHTRRFKITENSLRIEDELSGEFPDESRAWLHFHPQQKVEKTSRGALNLGDLEIRSNEGLEVVERSVAECFHRRAKAPAGVISFTNNLFIEIEVTRS